VSVVRIDVAPDPAHVRVVRLVAVSLARLHGVDEEVVEDVRLAVGEACGRAVAAHAQAELDAPVVVDFEGDIGLTVTVSDTIALPAASGAAAVALLAGHRPADEAPADYFETAPEVIALLEGLADDVTVNTGQAGTAVRLHWSSGT
jgi:serine/threonine-protein kinase RsbW